MNEFLIIKKYFSNLSKKNKGTFGLSDDIFFDYQKKIALSIDTYNEETHFLNFKNPELVIKKALRASISDLICKGINPEYYFISFSGNNNHLSKKNIFKICLALKQEQKKYNIILSGGDTTRSNKLSITISSIGYSKRLPVLRSGAKNNDDIYITNNIGDAFMGLNVLKKKIKLSKKSTDYFIKQFYLPNIPIKFSKKIHLFANSSIDISDGFFQDLKHILTNSNLSSEIFINNIPVSVYLNLYLKKKKKNKFNFISNGDDYQILFTASSNKRSLIKKISSFEELKITRIGKIVNYKQKSSIIDRNGSKIKLNFKGHFHNFS